MRKIAGILVVLAVSPFAPASFAAPQQEPHAKALELEARSWMVPVHTQPDDPEGGQYGLWAAAPGYKASFHEGFAFYPVLGEEAPENLPFAWRTESATLGDAALFEPGSKPAISSSPWRVEMRLPGLLEAYDVREDGVEQSFRIEAQPAAGDLVIRGRISTRLSTEATECAHRALVFRDGGGIARVRYGEAFACDAAGRRTTLTTRFDGECIELRLAASWLAAAAFPVTVDPLTSPVTISTGTVLGASPDIAHDPRGNRYWVTHSRAVSASDYDLYGYLIDDDFANGPVLVHTDLSSSWSSRYSQVGYVYNPPFVLSGRWVIAFERQFNAGACRIRVHLHDGSSASLNSGPIPDCPIATGDLFWQYLQIDPGTQQLVSSNGLAIQIR